MTVSIHQLLDSAESAIAAVRAALPERETRRGPEEHLLDLDIATAALIAGVTVETARSWAVRYGLGAKVGGRWRVNAKLWREFCAGRGVRRG